MQVPELTIIELDEKLAGILGRNQARIQCRLRRDNQLETDSIQIVAL